MSRRMRKAAIIVSFLPLAGYVLYAILVFTQVLQVCDVYLTIQAFGILWCFFAIIFAFTALWYNRTGSILMILAGVLFFVSVLLTNHYPGRHLPLSGIYTIGGILHFINAFFLEKREPQQIKEKVGTRRKLIYIACFVAFGVGLGFWSAWHDGLYDTPLLLNPPGYWIGVAFHGMWGRFVSDTIPWLLDIPRVFVLSSTLFWGIVGTLFSLFLKPKLIALIMGAYLVIFGGMTAWYYWG